MVCCAIMGCSNHDRNMKEQNYTFHRFPRSNENCLKKWIVACKRADYTNAENSRVCSRHFDQSDYERDLKGELLGLPLKRVLKPDAVPHLFVPTLNSTTQEDVIHSDRRKRAEKRLILLDSPSFSSPVIEGTTEDDVPCSDSKISSADPEDPSQQPAELISLIAENGMLKQRVESLEEQLNAANEEISRLKQYYSAFEGNFSGNQQQVLSIQLGCGRRVTPLLGTSNLLNHKLSRYRRAVSMLIISPETIKLNEMMNRPSSPADFVGGGLKTEVDFDMAEVVIKEEPRSDPFESGVPDVNIKVEPIDLGSCGEDLIKNDDVKIKEEPIELDEPGFIPDETIVTEENISLETTVTIKCDAQDYLKDETEETPFRDCDLEDQEALQDCPEDSGGPSDTGTISAGVGRFRCYYCQSTYHKKSLLAVHVAIHQQGQADKLNAPKKLLCPHCDFRSHGPNPLRKHIMTHDDLSLQCPHCDYLARNQRVLANHMLKHKGIIYQCQHCPYITTHHRYLIVHRNNKHEKVIKKCHFCNFSGYAYKVLRHESTIHRGELYSCNQCTLKCSNRKELRRHTSSEHSLLYKCHHCGYENPMLANLRYHIKTHFLFHKCSHCDSVFHTRRERTLHVQAHHKILPVFFTMDQL